MKKVVIGIVIGAAIVLVALFVAAPTAWESVFSPTTNTSGSSAKAKSEPYEVSFHVYVQCWKTGWEWPGFLDYNPVGQVTIRNTDSIAKIFTVEISHYYGDEVYTKEFTLEIQPGQIKTATMSYRLDISEFSDQALLHNDEHRKKYVDGDWGIDYRITSVR